MNLSQAVTQVQNLTDLQVIDEDVRKLIQRRRKEILVDRKNAGQQVGFVYSAGRGGRKATVKCNATIKEFQGEYCVVTVVAPVRFATMVVQIDQAMLVEAFQIVEKIDSELRRGEEEGEAGADDPLGGIG